MKPIHNQGKQALKRIRQRLGLAVNRLPLPDGIQVETKKEIVSGDIINRNPKLWERLIVKLN